ncbi:MAG: transcription-repair coupling factor (superfamily II helicase) [Phycisphaerales bacterium]
MLNPSPLDGSARSDPPGSTLRQHPSRTPECPLPADLLQPILSDPSVTGLAGALARAERVVATGSVGSSTGLVAAALAQKLDRPVVLLVAHPDDADETEAEINGLLGDRFALRLPALEAAPGESGLNIEQFAERMLVLRRLLGPTEDRPRVFVAPMAAVMQAVPKPERLDSLLRVLDEGSTHDPSALAEWLVDAGYTRMDVIEEPGQFAQRGGIIDVFTPAVGEQTAPVRLDFFGDDLERITEIDLETMGSDRRLDKACLVAIDPKTLRDRDGISVLELLDPEAVALIHETLEVVEQGRGYFERALDSVGLFGPPAVLKLLSQRFSAFAELNQFSAGAADADTRITLAVSPLPPFERDAAAAFNDLAELADEVPVRLCCRNEAEAQRAGELLAEHPQSARNITIGVAYLHRGFIVGEDSGNGGGAGNGGGGGGRTALVPYHEVLHRFDARRKSGKLKSGRTMDTFLDFEVGTYVVHAEHGIALFLGLMVMKPRENDTKYSKAGKAAAEPQEYLTLEFAGKSRLHVPCAQIDLVQRYVGGFSGKPPLSHIGGTKWKNQKAKVAESVRDLAGEMLRVRAAREHMPGIRYPADTAWQKEFEAEFPYDETEDQLAAINEIKKDMSSDRPMDRLICGDVGFGKTEVAIRAAFKACEYGKQVAVLVPTTILAEQHERTFADRFADYPFKVRSLSRFKTTKEVNDTLRSLRKGEIDVVIGTHRLLSKDVKFADLGLVVIDEEQRFGVEHKERLLQLRMTVDVLTLSATPIPRTLHMAMLGLRDISSLTTPPADRRSIVTEVIPYNTRRIARAIERELAREGQVFFVHNRVYNIQSVADDIKKLVPHARVIVGHGQMPSKELESVMLKFMRRQADVLVSTTIIESGVDIPTANTMLINDADRFGLAELHQLRGRVGRFKHRAYCYFLLPEDRTVKEVAQKRLLAIEQFSMLGAGFKIAMRDLEIRGAGNLLGAEQSGHIAAVGYEMFCRLLDQAVTELQDTGGPEPIEHVAIDIGVTGIIPKPYIPSDARRMEAYRRISVATDHEQLDQVLADLTSAYGSVPKAVQRLLDLARLRTAVRALGVRALARRGDRLVFMSAEPERVAERLRASSKSVKNSGSVSVVDPERAQTNARSPSGKPLAEVYWTPPPGYLEPETLMRILPRRLELLSAV